MKKSVALYSVLALLAGFAVPFDLTAAESPRLSLSKANATALLTGSPSPQDIFTIQEGAHAYVVALVKDDVRAPGYSALIETPGGLQKESVDTYFFREAPGSAVASRITVISSKEHSYTTFLALFNVEQRWFYASGELREGAFPLSPAFDAEAKVAATRLTSEREGRLSTEGGSSTVFSIAADVDFAAYTAALARKSSAAAEALALLYGAQLFLEKQAGASLTVSGVHVWAKGSSPYLDANLNSVLKEFSNKFPLSRSDAAVLFFGGRTPEAGLTSFDSLCTPLAHSVLAVSKPREMLMDTLAQQLREMGMRRGVSCSRSPAEPKKRLRRTAVIAVFAAAVAACCMVLALIYAKRMEKRITAGLSSELRKRGKETQIIFAPPMPKRRPKVDFEEKLAMAGIRTEQERKQFRRMQLAIVTALPAVAACAIYLHTGGQHVITGAVAAGAAGYLLLLRWLDGLIAERQFEIQRRLPAFTEQLTICITGALDVGTSLQHYVMLNERRKTPNMLCESINIALKLLSAGVDVREALGSAARQTGVTELEHVCGFLAQSAEHGGEVVRQMEALSEAVQQQYHLNVESKISSLPVKVTFPLMLVFAGFFAILFAGVFTQVSGILSSAG